MAIDRIFRHIIITGICSIVFASGCGPQGEKPVTTPTQPKKQAPEAVKAAPGPAEEPGVKIELRPAANAQADYKVTTQVRRTVKWEGPVPEKPAFEESSNEDKVEMVFNQRVQSLDPSGRIIEQIMIEQLKYFSTVKNQTIMDFDSTRQSDANSPLAKLIMQIYSIVVEPNDYIASISAAWMIAKLMDANTVADRAGRHLLSPEAITDRHATLLLPRADEARLEPGGRWSRVKTFSFGRMGIKSYEKIYTLREIRDVAGHKIAIIDMNAIPSSEIEEKYRNQQANAEFPQRFDTNETYTGSGEIDLTAGFINNYHENFRTSWIAALPSSPALTEDVNEPVVLRLTAERTYDLEKVK
jgi:hypothetical protein